MKKIENPLKEGLPSKIYYKAYAGIISRYQIARELYNIPRGQIPPTAKVSNTVRDLINKKYVSEIKDEGVRSNAEPLLIELEKDLAQNNIQLTPQEREELFKVLDNELRFFVEKKNGGNINAYTELGALLGSIVYIKEVICTIQKQGKKQSLLLEKLLKSPYMESKISREKIDKIYNIQISPALIKKLNFLIPPIYNGMKNIVFQEIPKILKEGKI